MFRSLPARGFAVLDPAMPAPKAGCITNHGAATVPRPISRGGNNPNVRRTGVDPNNRPVEPLPDGAHQPDIVVLLTDGATTQGVAPLKAAQEAVDRQLRVYTIGFGTPAGAQLVCSREQLGSESLPSQFRGGGGGGGRPGVDGPLRTALRIDERTLQSIADLTGGTYHRAADAEQLVEVFRNLPKEIVLQKQFVEVSFGFAALGALLALAATTLSLLWNRYG